MWDIPLFDVSFDRRELAAVQAVMRSKWLTMGDVTARFEQRFAELVGVRHAIAVSSCTAALHLAHRALDIGSGDEVICPSLTFVASANAVRYVGARPVFADIGGMHDLCIAAEEIERNITAKTRAILVMHYAGWPCDMEHVMNIARSRGLRVIEDCAHAVGASRGGTQCGAFGDIGCFSFFSNKNMTTGEGGMLTTDSDRLADRLRRLRSHAMTTLTLDRHRGHSFSYDVTDLGYNYRTDELHAAIGLVQLEKLAGFNHRRAELFRHYHARLADVQGVQLPFADVDEDVDSAYHILPIIVETRALRDGLMAFLRSRKIQSSIHYPPVHLFEHYRATFGFCAGVLPRTEQAARQLVTLPLYPDMRAEQVDTVCEAVETFIQSEGSAA